MLGIAYAASIGGLGTLIGTPPNALLAGFMRESYGYEIMVDREDLFPGEQWEPRLRRRGEFEFA